VRNLTEVQVAHDAVQMLIDHMYESVPDDEMGDADHAIIGLGAGLCWLLEDGHVDPAGFPSVVIIGLIESLTRMSEPRQN